jgi:hypothetical protein
VILMLHCLIRFAVPSLSTGAKFLMNLSTWIMATFFAYPGFCKSFGTVFSIVDMGTQL